MPRRIGVIGCGNLGQFLISKIFQDENYELAFVWNRTKSVLSQVVDPAYILDDLKHFASKSPELIVEVAHPSITKMYGKWILNYCDFMIGSPTALCDERLLEELKSASVKHGLYVPSGAFWGGDDIKKLSDAKLLQSMTVTMKKHPSSLKLEGYLKERNAEVGNESVVLYEGPVRGVCSLAPHNTNTMAAAAIAASDLGFDGVTGRLIADPSLINYHIVEVEATGFPKEDGSCFSVHTVRRNPAVTGEVTGFATYAAYYGSLKRAGGRGPGIHLC